MTTKTTIEIDDMHVLGCMPPMHRGNGVARPRIIR